MVSLARTAWVPLTGVHIAAGLNAPAPFVAVTIRMGEGVDGYSLGVSSGLTIMMACGSGAHQDQNHNALHISN